MTDRNVQHPNRYQLVKVEDTDDIYDVIPAPGTVVNEGTLLNKQSLLQDITCELLGLPTTAVPNDAFFRLALPSDRYSVKVTVLSPGGIPLAGITVNGLETLSGGTVVTGSDGTALGLASQANATLIADNPFLDISGNASQQFTLETDVINQCTLKFSRSSTTSRTFSFSQMVRLSPDVGTFNCSAIGGGANGSPGTSTYSEDVSVSATGGNGGNAGQIVNQANVPNPGEPIAITVGAANGNSSVGSYITARGGAGAAGGTGAYYWETLGSGSSDRDRRLSTPGADSSGFLYPPTSVGGAGGGAGCRVSTDGVNMNVSESAGGAPGGGDGADSYGASSIDGKPGTSPGAGGGGGYGYIPNGILNTSGKGGAGAAGLCGMTWSFINEVAA